jgi:predicted dinucleotide-binding enzyme
MRVGILGSGLMGGKLGTLFARAGHEVVFSYARSKEKLNRLARDARGNARAGTPREAAQGADALLLAVHWSLIDDVLNQAGDLAGKVIISCSLPLNAANTELVLGHTTSGAEALAKKGARRRGRRRVQQHSERSALRRVRGAGQSDSAEHGVLRVTHRPAKTSPRR